MKQLSGPVAAAAIAAALFSFTAPADARTAQHGGAFDSLHRLDASSRIDPLSGLAPARIDSQSRRAPPWIDPQSGLAPKRIDPPLGLAPAFRVDARSRLAPEPRVGSGSLGVALARSGPRRLGRLGALAVSAAGSAAAAAIPAQPTIDRRRRTASCPATRRTHSSVIAGLVPATRSTGTAVPYQPSRRDKPGDDPDGTHTQWRRSVPPNRCS